MADIVQLRWDYAAEWTDVNPLLAAGEFGIERDTNRFKIGTGVTAWNALPYFGADGGPGHLPAIPFSWGDAPQAVFTFPVDGVITEARLRYETPFNGAGASVRIGLASGDDALLPAEWNNPYSSNWFENNPDLAVIAGQQVWITITPGTASQGSGFLFLDFFPDL